MVRSEIGTSSTYTDLSGTSIASYEDETAFIMDAIDDGQGKKGNGQESEDPDYSSENEDTDPAIVM